jgi:hypothetical protein
MSFCHDHPDSAEGAWPEQTADGLTMLGMIIGVAAVITMVALGHRRAVRDRRSDPRRRHEHDLVMPGAMSAAASSRRGHVQPHHAGRREGDP